MKKKTITLCMIVKNEESLIKGCLESAASYVDEIVVVDTGSTDHTLNVICQSNTRKKVRIFHHLWNDDFAEARNLSISNASGDWIIILDADERISGKDWSLIRSYIGTSDLIGYSMTTRNYGSLRNMPGWRASIGEYPDMEGAYPGWNPTSKVRLFPNNRRILFKYRVHELVEESILLQKGCIKPCRIAVHHLGPLETSDDLSKEEYYLSLVERKMTEYPDDALPFFEAGTICYGLKRFEDADRYFRLSLERLKKRNALYLRTGTVLWKIGVVAAELGNPEEAVKYYEQALQENPHCAEALNNWGVLLERYHRPQEALEKYRQALSIDNQNHIVQDNLQRIEKRLVIAKARLSLCMIVKNEEKNIDPCLEGIKDAVDEIIIVDTGSTDATPQLAGRYGAKVFSFQWCDDFSAARNESIRHATGDYILWLDADDRIGREEAGKLLQMKKIMPFDKNKAYLLKLVNQRGDIELDESWQLRIFPNSEGLIFHGKIHETVSPSIEKLGIDIIKADIRIIHTGYSGDDVCRDKAQRNIAMMKKELEDNPDNFMLWYLIGGAYCLIGNYSDAMYAYRKVVLESDWDKSNPKTYANTLIQIGKIHHALAEYNKATGLYNQALEFLRDDAMLWFVLGESLFALERYNEALDAFDKVRDENTHVDVYTTPVFKIRYLREFYRGRCYMEMGNMLQAINALNKTLEIHPANIDAMKLLGILYLRQGRLEDAKNLFEKVVITDRSDPTVLSNLALIYSKEGKADEAEALYREALGKDPDCIEALVNIGYLYFSTGKYEQAKKFMEKVVTIDNSALDAFLVLSYIYSDNGDFESFLQVSDQIVRLMGLTHFHIESFEDLSRVYIEISNLLMKQGKNALVNLACKTAECMLKHHQKENSIMPAVISLK